MAIEKLKLIYKTQK